MEYTKSSGDFFDENKNFKGELLKDIKVNSQFKIWDKGSTRYVLVKVLSGHFEGKSGYFPLKKIETK